MEQTKKGVVGDDILGRETSGFRDALGRARALRRANKGSVQQVQGSEIWLN